MGGAIKQVANVATLGLSGALLGDKAPTASNTSVAEVGNTEVSAADADSYAADKKRRAQAAGLSSTILGGAATGTGSTTTKTLLGA
jgi:hypothetical protein